MGTDTKAAPASNRPASSEDQGTAFAEDYADQNEDDYGALEQAVRSGRVQAVTDV